jgi:hypothetical protein
MAEHIDKIHLNTNLRYRFDYLTKFLNFTKDDINILNLFAPILFPYIPFIVETVYKKLYSFDITKQFFILRNPDFESFSSNNKNDLSVISAQTDFRKDMLSVYLKSILIQSEWNDTFLQYLSQIGELHGNKSNFKTVNVDYIHINILLGYLEHLIIDTIWNIENIDFKNKSEGIKAINKVFWIQNNFFTMHYGKSLKDNSITNRISEEKSKCSFK